MRERLKKTMPSKAHHEILTAVGSICTQNLLLPIALVITVVGAVVTALVPPLILEKIVDGLTAGNPMPIAQAFSYFAVVALAGLLESTAGKPFDRIRTEADPRPAQSDVRKAVAAVRRYVE